MYYPEITENTNTTGLIDTWLGYNHNYRISAGEFYDEENVCADDYPLLSSRKLRAALIEGTSIRGVLLFDNTLCYLDGNTLHYGQLEYDMSDYVIDPEDTTSVQQLLRFGAYVLIFPAQAYINLYDTDDKGSFGSSVTIPNESDITVTYTMSEKDGSVYDNLTVAATAPSSPSDGDYWLSTSKTSYGMYQYSTKLGSWESVATSYVKVTIPDDAGVNFLNYFDVGDAVSVNITDRNLEDLTSRSVIRDIGYNWFTIYGRLDSVASYTYTASKGTKITFQREVPDLDYVCVSGNRLWGCHAGENDKFEYINEIYASKLGDFKNFYVYDGISTDSYAVSIGQDGPWTGCIEYQGYPTFFKDNAIIKIYGSYPSQYQLISQSARGVQSGSYRSLKVLNEYLIYKSSTDVCVYDGSTPTSISANLGKEPQYYDAVAGSVGNKYYISMQDVSYNNVLFSYDMEHDVWSKEDAIQYIAFTSSENGQTYAATGTRIYGLGTNENILFMNKLVDEEYVDWYAESGDIGIEYATHKSPMRFTIRAYLPIRSEIAFDLSLDGSEYRNYGTLRGEGNIKTYTIAIPQQRCDYYSFRLSGHGEFRIYTLMMEMEDTASEERGYRF